MTLYELDQFKAEASQRLAQIDLLDASEKLGCKSPDKLEFRMNKVFRDPYLGLDDGYYDYKVDTPTFIRLICDYLGMDAGLTEQVIEAIDERLSAYNDHRPYVFVETDFDVDQSSATLLDMVFMEPRCQLKIELAEFSVDCNEMLTLVGEKVIQHFESNQGVIKPWGQILGYVYFHDDETQVNFNGLGEVVMIQPHVQPDPEPNKAQLKLKA